MTATGSISKAKWEGGTLIEELGGGYVLIASFSDPEEEYKVHAKTGYCSCPRYQKTGICIKHVVTADALLKARNLKWFSRTAEEWVLETARKVFAPVRAAENSIDSYLLYLRVCGCRYATKGLIHAAAKRHGRVLALKERKNGRAA